MKHRLYERASKEDALLALERGLKRWRREREEEKAQKAAQAPVEGH